MARKHLLHAVLVYCFLLITDLTPLARGHLTFLPPDWYFPWLRLQPRLQWVVVCGVALILYMVGAWYLVRRGSALRLKAWAFVGAALLPIMVAALEGDPLFTLFGRLTTGWI